MWAYLEIKSGTHCIVHGIIFTVPQQRDNIQILPSLSDLETNSKQIDQNLLLSNRMSFIGCNPLSIQVHLFLGGTISSGLCPSDIPPWQSEILFCVNENAKDGSAHYQLPSKSIQPSFLMLPAPVLPLGIEISIQCSPPQ